MSTSLIAFQALPFLGNSQLQVLSVIGSLLLLAAHLLMSGLVKERYSTLYIGDLYKRSLPPATTDKQQTLIDAEAT